MAKGNPISAHLKLLRGSPGHQKIHEEVQPELAPDIPEPPKHLHRYASAEWRRIATECYRLRLLTTLDVQSLAAYCQAYAHWRKAIEQIARAETLNPDSGGMTVARIDKEGNTYHIRNPMLTAANHAAREMLRFASEFGLTPAARARLASGLSAGEKPRGKFDGYLAS